MTKEKLVTLLLEDIAFRDFITDVYIMVSLSDKQGQDALSAAYAAYKSGIDSKKLAEISINSKKYL